MSYTFIDKDKLMKTSRKITTKVETMCEAFDNFTNLLEGLEKEPYLDFQNLGDRAGINKKQLTKLGKAVENYRNIYFQRLSEIFQTSLDDFGKGVIK